MKYAISLTACAGIVLSLVLSPAATGQTRPATKTPSKRMPAGSASGPRGKPAADYSPGADDASDEAPKSAADGNPSSPKMKDDIDAEIDSKLKAKKKREERKDDFELRGTRTSPFDLAIPYFKQNHWTLFHLELIANNFNKTLEIRSAYESVKDSPHEVSYRRLIHLIKGEERPYRIPMLLPETHATKQIQVSVYPPDGVLPVPPLGNEAQKCNRLEADQFLIVVLSPEPERFRFLSGMQCVTPGSDTGIYVDDEPLERRRYFYLVLPQAPEHSMVADTALAWTTTSYCVWDDLDPGALTGRQQEAMVDWLHWGGQLVVSGGAAATKLEQSFLAPYLPADVVGSDNVADLSALVEGYPTPPTANNLQQQTRPINILPGKPIYVAKLKPRAGAVVREKAKGDVPLVVERSVGRGRVVMAAFSLYQPELAKFWTGCYDTFWRKQFFDLPETRPSAKFRESGNGRTYDRLPARALSRVRYLSRDLGATGRKANLGGAGTGADGEAAAGPQATVTPTGIPYPGYMLPAGDPTEWLDTVAEWRDEAAVPATARQALKDAAGIKIPPSGFVVIAAISYVVALVPLNWLVCRFGLRRVEWAWLGMPVIVLAFAFGIVKSAEFHVGFDMISHEIDVVETFAGYPRAHLSRFTCVYSGSRRRCEFLYDEPSALALPMATGMQRGQERERLSLDWDMPVGKPVALGRYEIHPRSIGMVRSEEMVMLAGGLTVERADGGASTVIRNQTPWKLQECHLFRGDEMYVDAFELPPGEATSVPSGGNVRRISTSGSTRKKDRQGSQQFEIDLPPLHSPVKELGDLSPDGMLELLEHQSFGPGTRLVGWMPQPMPGQDIDPKPDQKIGFTIFVVHLESGQ